ncbi:MAG: SH3 domain-containing protein [archaeon]|nr:SH3 domain-containing protein [archaeon]
MSRFIRTSFRTNKDKNPKKGGDGLRFDPTSLELPLGIEKCIDYLENHVSEAGIFRLSPSASQLEALRVRMAAPTFSAAFDLSDCDPHVIAGLFKGFLREMVEPVSTFELYDCWLSAVLPFRDARVACVRKLLTFLPPCNTVLLQRTCALLRKVAANSEVNKMNASNLAIVFAPTFFRRQGETMQEMVQDQETLLALVKHLINDYEYIFEDKPVPVDPSPEPSADPSLQPPTSQSSPAPTITTTITTASGTPLQLAIALWDHTALSGAELSFVSRDLILVEETETPSADHWFGSILAHSPSRGFFQKAFVQLVDPSIRVAQAHSAYTSSHPDLLSCAQEDLFLLDPSCQHPDWYEADHLPSHRHGLIPAALVKIIFPSERLRPPAGRPNQLLQTGRFYKRLSRVHMGELSQKIQQVKDTLHAPPSSSPLAATPQPDPVVVAASPTPTISLSVNAAVTFSVSSPNPPPSDPIPELSESLSPPPPEQQPPSEQPEPFVEPLTNERAVALFDYTATPDTPELSFKKGDIMDLENRQSTGWLEVTLNGQKGVVPSTYVQVIV